VEKFIPFTGIAAPLIRANVDTYQIIPKQFLKSIKRTGFGQNLFDEWRYLDEGKPGESCVHRPLNDEFILNQPRYQGAQILVVGKNFGCGSSREHAPWALLEYGFKVIIAPSFADIFYNNCFKNGILPIVLDDDVVEQLQTTIVAEEGYQLTVDLEQQRVQSVDGAFQQSFEVDPFRQHCLLNGLDDIGLTLQEAERIRAYEARRQKEAPWIFNALHEATPK